MKTTLTDHKTGRKMTILHDSKWIPALGEDGIQYFILTNLCPGGQLREDCTVLDLKNKMGIKPVRYPTFGVTEPVEFVMDRGAFNTSTSIEQYTGILRKKGIVH